MHHLVDLESAEAVLEPAAEEESELLEQQAREDPESATDPSFPDQGKPRFSHKPCFTNALSFVCYVLVHLSVGVALEP